MGYDKISKVSKWKHGDHVQYFSHSSESYSRLCLDRLLQEKMCSNFLFMYLSFFSNFGQVLSYFLIFHVLLPFFKKNHSLCLKFRSIPCLKVECESLNVRQKDHRNLKEFFECKTHRILLIQTLSSCFYKIAL